MRFPESHLMDTKRKLVPHLRRYTPHPQQRVRKMGILPHPKVYPTNESVEDPPEGLLEEVPSSRVEEEAPTHAKVASRTSENAAPEGPVEELPRDEAEKEFPSNTKVASGVSDHDWIVDRRFDSSSEDEDSSGHSVTTTALVHAEACSTDSED